MPMFEVRWQVEGFGGAVIEAASQTEAIRKAKRGEYGPDDGTESCSRHRFVATLITVEEAETNPKEAE